MLKTVFAAMLAISLVSFNLPVVYADETPKVEVMPADEGIVISSIDTGGYTYMELANGDKKFWIAAPATKVSNGDHIRFLENMRMHNYTSKTLNRTFNEVIFVISTQVKVKEK